MKNKILKKYIIENLNPRKNQVDRIKKLYDELNNYLGKDKCFQTGSYARFTAIRPVNDLDIFYIFGNDLTVDEALDSLPQLAKDLEENFSDTCSEKFTVEIQTHSIKLQFEDSFSIDIVPAVETNKTTSDLHTQIYLVPDEETGNWISSDPKGYKEITKEIDEKSDKNLRKSVRFVKSWRKGCKKNDDNFKLKSFHIEQILIEIFKEDNNISLYDAIKLFYENIPANLLTARFRDRADNSIFIDKYIEELDSSEINQIINLSENQLRKIKSIGEATEESQILDLIAEIMLCSSSPIEQKTNPTPTTNSFNPSGQHISD